MYTTAQVIALTMVPGMSSTATRRVVESDIDFDMLSSVPADRLVQLGLRRTAIEAMGLRETLGSLLGEGERQLAVARETSSDVMTWWDSSYPPLLREIYAPPVVLYTRGQMVSNDCDGVAIVGTRSASTYGRLSAERYAQACAASGVTVVSGLARGVDSFAHAAALLAGGRTLAVVACGLDRIAPLDSVRLAGRIEHGGAILSEHRFGIQAMPAYFPQRNRIISGMTRGVVVIESDERGGSMITAGFALDQNREVFALPGLVTSPKSRGTNQLIRTDRARLTQSPEDVLEALGYRVALPGTMTSAVHPHDLTLFESRVIDAVGLEPLHVDTLCELTELPSNDVLVALLTLEFKGLVRQMAGKMFVRCR